MAASARRARGGRRGSGAAPGTGGRLAPRVQAPARGAKHRPGLGRVGHGCARAVLLRQAGHTCWPCRRGAQAQRRGLGQGPWAGGGAEFVAGRAPTLPRCGLGPLEHATSGDNSLDAGAAVHLGDGREAHEAAERAEARDGGQRRRRGVCAWRERHRRSAPPHAGSCPRSACRARGGGLDSWYAGQAPKVQRVGASAGCAPGCGRARGGREQAAAPPWGHRVRRAMGLLRRAAVEGWPGAGLPKDTGEMVCGTQSGQPIPGHETRTSDNAPGAGRGYRRAQQVGSGGHVSGDQAVALVVQKAHIPGAGRAVETTGKGVLVRVEAPEGFSSSVRDWFPNSAYHWGMLRGGLIHYHCSGTDAQ